MPGQTNGPITADALAAAVSGWAGPGHGTLARRLANALRQAIHAGLIEPSTRLPPERLLAKALGVGRSTVTAALDELRGEGLLESRQGSGTVVKGWGPTYSPLEATRIAEHFSELPGIDLAAGNPPDPSHWPAVKLEVGDLIADGGGPGVHPLGLASLRAELAAIYRQHGLLTDTSEIHVTSGAHQAMGLAVRACSRPGDLIAVEETSYPGIFDVLDATRTRALPLETDGAGIIPSALQKALAEHEPKVLYLQNGPHNPTGRAPAPGRIRELAAIADRHETVVVEDSTLADLTFTGRVRPELADLCRHAVVVSVGSLSKVAWAGLRIGWMRAPGPLIERTKHLRLASDLGPSVPAQLLALQLLPHYEEMAATRRSTLREAVDLALPRIASDFPGWKVDRPEGSSVLWIELPVADSGPFVQVARRYGVHVAPGSVARADRRPDPHIRVCVDRAWPLVEVGLQRLEQAWKDLRRSSEPVLG